MEKIKIAGTKANEKIEIEIVKTLSRSEFFGYNVLCKLIIDVGCYHVYCEDVVLETEQLEMFGKELASCYERLSGEAHYDSGDYINLDFEIVMQTGGQALLSGRFQAIEGVDNILEFVMETDQTCFPEVLFALKEIKERFSVN